MDQLTTFLRRAAAQPFAYGRADCCLFLADWVVELTGRDPARHLRGVYSNENGWRNIVAKAGGMAPLVDYILTGSGLTPVMGEPPIGAIGVVRLPTIGDAGAIRVAGRWVMKLSRGLWSAPATALTVWSLP